MHVFLREPDHFPHLDYYFGERQSALLFRYDFGFYREAERIYEREE